MRLHINPLLVVCFITLASAGFAREAAALPGGPASAGDANAVSAPSFPYTAEIIADNIYIRSGPGTYYYYCGRLNKGDVVEVVSSQFGWSRIVPPAGSFSWISMQYVSIDGTNPAIGIVTSDSVRVYAGSDFVKPLHSTTLQLKLNRGDKVKLLGEQKDDYYKIAPPAGGYLWVSTKFTKPLVAGVGVSSSVIQRTEPNGTVVTVISVEQAKLKEYYALEKQIQAERTKPAAQQNYTNIKKALVEIANNKRAGKAARYSEFVVKRIERFELALAVAKEIQLQDTQFKQVQERIDKARTSRLAKVEDLGRFAAVGQFQTFETYGPGNYRIINASGKTICYALPSSGTSKTDLSKFVGRSVGLVGTIEPHLPTKGALVRFTKVVELR